jgi:hypothetical protein
MGQSRGIGASSGYVRFSTRFNGIEPVSGCKTEGYAGGVRRPEVESYGAGPSGEEQREIYAAWLVSGIAFFCVV